MTTEPLAACLTDSETSALMYLAGVSMWTDAHPECPSIGAPGPQSRAMTKDLVFHLYFTGRLAPRRRTLRQRIGGFFCRVWRRWEICCAPEPEPQRHYRPSLFRPQPETDDA